MRLPFKIFHRLDFGAHNHRGFELRQIGGKRLDRRAVGTADDRRCARGQAEIDVASQQRAKNLRTVAERHDVDVDTGFLVKAELFRNDRRHVDDVGRRRRYADNDLGLRRSRAGSVKLATRATKTPKVLRMFVLPDFYCSRAYPASSSEITPESAILPDRTHKNNEGGLVIRPWPLTEAGFDLGKRPCLIALSRYSVPSPWLNSSSSTAETASRPQRMAG